MVFEVAKVMEAGGESYTWRWNDVRLLGRDRVESVLNASYLSRKLIMSEIYKQRHKHIS